MRLPPSQNGVDGQRLTSSRLLARALAPHTSVTEVARRHGLNPNLIYRWRHQAKAGALSRAPEGQSRFALVAVAAGSSAAPLTRRDHQGDCIIEVVLRNGRILRLSQGTAPTRVAPLADALEACGS